MVVIFLMFRCYGLDPVNYILNCGDPVINNKYSYLCIQT